MNLSSDTKTNSKSDDGNLSEPNSLGAVVSLDAWARPIEDIIIERLQRLKRANEDPKYRAVCLALCALDPVTFLNDWCWTYDPRLRKGATIPFRLFPQQEKFVRWLQEREDNEEDGLVEKSRDAGASWVACGYAVWKFLFAPGSSIGFGSRKEALVDKVGDPDSLFEKLRIVLRNLPSWMLPENFVWKRHDNFRRLINPENGSTVTGEAGDNIGRGGRKSLYFIDEAAFLQRPEKIEAALSQTTRCRIDISTPNGPGNPFAKKRFGGFVSVFRFHWRDDPRKTQAWYDREKKRLDSVTLAQEVDIDYNASIEGVVIPAKWVSAAVGFAKWLKDTKGLEMPTGERRAGLDIAEEGKDKSVFISGLGYVIDTIRSWGQLNTTQTANKAGNMARDMGVKTVKFDEIGIGKGVKGTWASSEHPLGFTSVPINVGKPGTARRWPNGRKGHEIFVSLKAEIWWMMRVRFERTYEYREQGIEHPLDKLISLPDLNEEGVTELVAQLSMPTGDTTDTNKFRVEGKKELKKRGVSSPDFAEALSMYFAPGPTVVVAGAS